jgi:hypothetical protein
MRMMTKTDYFKALAMVLAVTLVAALLLVLFAPVEPAQAAFPGQNGKIVFDSYPSVISMDPDGSNRITIGVGEEPDVSNYGKQVAYVAQDVDTGKYDIYTAPINGGEPSRITNTPEIREFEPTWSPDGKRIAYYAHDGNNYEIYTIPVTGGTPINVTNNKTNDYEPAWSPDGTRIAYSHWDGHDGEIATISSAGGQPTYLTKTDSSEENPDWSPNGRKIVYNNLDWEGQGHPFDDHDDSDIYEVLATGGKPKALTDTSLSRWERVFGCGGYGGCDLWAEWEQEPAYSPDGTKIVFYKPDYAAEAEGEIYTMPSTGGKYTKLTNNSEWDDKPDWGMVPDNAGPETTITSGPARYFNSNTVFFYFVSSEPGSTFECALDGPEFDAHTFLPCDSPQVYFDLIDGNTYTFFVRATDPAGNGDTSFATHTWTVDLNKPTITGLNPSPDSETTNRTPTIRATVTDAITELDKPGIKLYIDNLEIQNFSYDRATDKLTYKPSTNLSVDGHEVMVVATDAAKNQNTETWSFRIVR